MSLISSKEALIALANDQEVQIESNNQWVSVENCQVYQFLHGNCNYKFRLKPQTITINGIEVPKPFEPKDGEKYYYLWDCQDGYGFSNFRDKDPVIIGAWRNEEEIKQVVEVLRSVFK